jgi:NADH dehydrogenase/NADH oxidase (H2O2-forming)
MGKSKVEALRTHRETKPAHMVIIATGIKPNTKITRNTNITTIKDAIKISRKAETNTSNIYAVGDCALSHDMITGKEVYRPLGFIAAHYARTAAKNIAGIKTETKGIIPTMHENLGKINITKIGLSTNEAQNLNLTPTMKCTKTPQCTECIVLQDNNPIGYEAVSLTTETRNKAWAIYHEILESALHQ